MALGDVYLLGWVGRQVEEGQVGLASAGLGRLAVLAARLASERDKRMWKVELPLAATEGLQLAAPVKIEGVVRTLRAFLAGQERQDVLAVDGVFRQLSAGQL